MYKSLLLDHKSIRLLFFDDHVVIGNILQSRSMTDVSTRHIVVSRRTHTRSTPTVVCRMAMELKIEIVLPNRLCQPLIDRHSEVPNRGSSHHLDLMPLGKIDLVHDRQETRRIRRRFIGCRVLRRRRNGRLLRSSLGFVTAVQQTSKHDGVCVRVQDTDRVYFRSSRRSLLAHPSCEHVEEHDTADEDERSIQKTR
jgi:hypothetical protein